MKDPRLYTDLTVKEIREYLATKDAIAIPVGSIEQHGNHLPVLADSINAQGFSKAVAERLDILYLSAISCSYSGGCLPGTINCNPATLLAVLGDTMVSLSAQGFHNIFLILSHGGSENLTFLEQGLPILLRENPIMDHTMVVFLPAWRYSPSFMAALTGGDGHGGTAGTSLVMALRPDLVTDDMDLDDPETLAGMRRHPDFYQKYEKLADAPEVLPRITQKDSVRVGVMGDPTHATPEFGWQIVNEAADAMAALLRDLLANRTDSYHVVDSNLGGPKF